MKRLGLVSTQLQTHRYKKASQPHSRIPNILNREFNAVKPDQVWCGDVTYIWTGKRWSYLAVVLDLYGRKPVGWALSNSPDSELTSQALTMAYVTRNRPENVLYHSSLHKLAVQTAHLAIPHIAKYESARKLLGQLANGAIL